MKSYFEPGIGSQCTKVRSHTGSGLGPQKRNWIAGPRKCPNCKDLNIISSFGDYNDFPGMSLFLLIIWWWSPSRTLSCTPMFPKILVDLALLLLSQWTKREWQFKHINEISRKSSPCHLATQNMLLLICSTPQQWDKHPLFPQQPAILSWHSPPYATHLHKQKHIPSNADSL